MGEGILSMGWRLDEVWLDSDVLWFGELALTRRR